MVSTSHGPTETCPAPIEQPLLVVLPAPPEPPAPPLPLVLDGPPEALDVDAPEVTAAVEAWVAPPPPAPPLPVGIGGT